MKLINLLEKSSPILKKIYEHPFNQQLCEGTLSETVFGHYLELDERYLRTLSRALNLTADRCRQENHKQILISLANYIGKTERDFHCKYLAGLQHERFFSSEKKARRKISSIADYTQHLMTTAQNEPVEVAAASFLPCFSIYKGLGDLLKPSSNNLNSLYRRWLASYSSKKFSEATKLLQQVVEQQCESFSCHQRQEQVAAAFIKSAHFELAFLNEVFEPTGQKHRVSSP